jgi:hypothetical protein
MLERKRERFCCYFDNYLVERFGWQSFTYRRLTMHSNGDIVETRHGAPNQPVDAVVYPNRPDLPNVAVDARSGVRESLRATIKTSATAPVILPREKLATPDDSAFSELLEVITSKG